MHVSWDTICKVRIGPWRPDQGAEISYALPGLFVRNLLEQV